METFKSQMIDDLGRVLLSGELRTKMGWKTGEMLSMRQLDANTLILRLEKNPVLKCAICKKHDEPMMCVNGANVCEGCLEAIRKISF